MKRVLLATLLAACASDPAGGPADPGGFTVTDPTDADGDGIPEQLEDHLMDVFGPELRLPPDDIDWTRPANVDWYLPQVHMRFDHSGCPDDDVLGVGDVKFDTIAAQQHYLKKGGTGLCQHSSDASDLRASNKKALEFFLQPPDDKVHEGIPPARKDEWRVYTQVRPSSYVRGDGVAAAYDLQVWYFFAYNDATASINHEADWEHTTISLDANLEVVSVYLAAHHDGARFDDPSKLAWNDTHVVAYIADGSHATYESAGAHPGPVVEDHCYDGGPVWQSWANYKNLGEVGHILNGQTWAGYGGRWGEVGQLADTSGPSGPMFNGRWDTKNEY